MEITMIFTLSINISILSATTLIGIGMLNLSMTDVSFLVSYFEFVARTLKEPFEIA